MPSTLSILASGSSGNAAFLRTGTHGLLIDCGLGARELGARLAAVGASWAHVGAVVLTHTHGDHWNRTTFTHMLRMRVPLFAHANHHAHLDSVSLEHPMLAKHGLLRTFDGTPFEPVPGLLVKPVRVPHDSDPTYAFRIEQSGWSVGYASDVGHPTPELAKAFDGVDVLCLEFNHDEGMQRTSQRPRHLINRVLGRDGHLSNGQAAELCKSIGTQRLAALVQLHLSRECNRPELAATAGRKVLPGPMCRLWTARQDTPCGPIPLPEREPGEDAPRYLHQPTLPGLE